MKEDRLENILRKAGDFKLNFETSKEIDYKINEIIYGENISNISSYNIFSLKSFFQKIEYGFLLVFIVFISIFVFKNKLFKKVDENKIYQQIVSQIQEANIKKDVNLALSVYSDEFFKIHNKEKLKINIELLFKNFKDIYYSPKNKRIIVKKNKALIENDTFYIARSKNDKKIIKYRGLERIYLKKDRNSQWKIVAWVFQEKG